MRKASQIAILLFLIAFVFIFTLAISAGMDIRRADVLELVAGLGFLFALCALTFGVRKLIDRVKELKPAQESSDKMAE